MSWIFLKHQRPSCWTLLALTRSEQCWISARVESVRSRYQTTTQINKLRRKHVKHFFEKNKYPYFEHSVTYISCTSFKDTLKELLFRLWASELLVYIINTQKNQKSTNERHLLAYTAFHWQKCEKSKTPISSFQISSTSYFFNFKFLQLQTSSSSNIFNFKHLQLQTSST